MTGVLQWMATSSSEGTGEEGEAVGWLCTLGRGLAVQSSGTVGIRLSACGGQSGMANKAEILLGVCHSHPARMK